MWFLLVPFPDIVKMWSVFICVSGMNPVPLLPPSPRRLVSLRSMIQIDNSGDRLVECNMMCCMVVVQYHSQNINSESKASWLMCESGNGQNWPVNLHALVSFIYRRVVQHYLKDRPMISTVSVTSSLWVFVFLLASAICIEMSSKRV